MNQRKSIPIKKRHYIFARDNHECQYCGATLALGEGELDHLVPFSRGGNDSVINLVASCKSCNLHKGSLLLSTARIREMQDNIIRRTQLYDNQLKEHPITNRDVQVETHRRPSSILKKLPKARELFSNRSFHPGKEHHVVVYIKGEELCSIQYSRYYKERWEYVETIDNDNYFTPLTADEYTYLMRMSAWDIIDKTTELYHGVELISNNRGLYLLKVEGKDGYFTVYTYWIKGMNIVFHIDTQIASDTPTRKGYY